jgi:hypothetical protein
VDTKVLGKTSTDWFALENQHKGSTNMTQDTSHENKPDSIAVSALAVAEDSKVS